jgi:hypothetical protein
MDRRRFISLCIAGITGLAGCGSETEEGPEETPTPRVKTVVKTVFKTPSPTSRPTDSPTPTPPDNSSEFKGPTEENQKQVDLRYRDYTDEETKQIKAQAREFNYERDFRNIEERVGEYVYLTGTIRQVVEGDGYFLFLITLPDVDEHIAATWVGDRYLEGDEIKVWGEILGSESYETAYGAGNTIPAIAIAEINRQS